MDALSNYIGNSSYTFVPILVFVVIFLLAGLIGWINGWKTSLYFFGWNFVGLISGVLLCPSIVDGLGSIDFLDAVIKSAQEFIGVIILFLYLLVVNFLAFLFYWIFRGKLKKSIKTNKNVGKSNLFSRSVGMGIAVVSAAPITVFVSDTVSIMSEENGFTKFLDKMTKGFSGGKYEGNSEARIVTKNLGNLAKLAEAFADMSSDPTKAFNEIIHDQNVRNGLAEILNTDLSKNVNDIYEGMKKIPSIGDQLKDNNLKDVDIKDAENMPDNIGIPVSQERYDDLKTSFGQMFASDAIAQKILDKLVTKTN